MHILRDTGFKLVILSWILVITFEVLCYLCLKILYLILHVYKWSEEKERNLFLVFFVVMPLLGPNWHYSWHAVLPQVYVLLGRWNTPLWVLVCEFTSYRPVTSVVYTTLGSQFNDLLRRWYTPLWVHKFYDLLGRWYTPLWFHKLTTCCTFPFF